MDTPKKQKLRLIFADPDIGAKMLGIIAGLLVLSFFIVVASAVDVPPEPVITRASVAEVTWFRPKDGSHTVAANPRHSIPDGAYIEFVNPHVAPEAFVIVRKQGHMAKHAEADFDLCPEAFARLAPLSHGRLYNIEWRIVRQ